MTPHPAAAAVTTPPVQPQTPPQAQPPGPSQSTAPADAPARPPAQAGAAGPAVDGSDEAEPGGKQQKSDKRPPSRGVSMALAGRPVGEAPVAPERPRWPGAANAEEVYVPEEEFDVSDLAEVNRQMNRARARLFRVSQHLKGAQRELAEAQIEYDRAMRRALVSLSGGTEASRKAMAEIQCEPLENRVVVAKQVVEEWKKRSIDVRDDLKAIENISHNVRAQMDIR